MQAYFDNVWARTRQLRIGFITGLIVGALAGWFFHGLISLIIRFFFVLILLIPFVLALIAWWRLRREVDRVRASRTDEEWPPLTRRPFRVRPDEPVDDASTITVDSWESWEVPERQRTPDRDIRRDP
jgi:hypothetical protein